MLSMCVGRFGIEPDQEVSRLVDYAAGAAVGPFQRHAIVDGVDVADSQDAHGNRFSRVPLVPWWSDPTGSSCMLMRRKVSQGLLLDEHGSLFLDALVEQSLVDPGDLLRVTFHLTANLAQSVITFVESAIDAEL